MGPKFQIRSKKSKMPIKTQDILGLNVIVTLQSLHFEDIFLKPLFHAEILLS